MKILCACEESQEVCKAFRARGHEAYSCDILPCSGRHPEWHIQDDVHRALKPWYTWDMVVAFPPCTHLCTSGARWFKEKQADGRQQEGIDLFMLFTRLDHIPRVAIENPVGIMSTNYRKPDQIIQPWQFGDPYEKITCLWVKGLPKLEPTQIVSPGKRQISKGGKSTPEWYSNAKKADRAKIRSKTFTGVALAMAEQWG